VSNLDLPFGADESELDVYLREIDDALDACFLADMDLAFAKAAEARREPPPEPSAAVNA
jgi:hypothetical protein